jgi:phosphatidylethanolamine-binding protein (PEBP) family uncharacterized protein
MAWRHQGTWFGIALAICGVACAGQDAPTGSEGTRLTVISADAVSGAMPVTHTCDGDGTSPPISWSGAPSGTAQYALVMTTTPTGGTTKYNWVLYGIPATTTSIASGGSAGTVGFADDGGGLAYAPPCSQGPGLKQYTLTVYALSAAPNLSGLTPTQVTGSALLAALVPVTLETGSLTLGVTRSVATINCGYVRQSIESYRVTNGLAITCDSTYAWFASTGIQWAHPMMVGITATNQQVPLAQNFTGSNAWRIPLVPQVASTKTSAVDGPIGLAVNGIPIFNPCKQGGCSGPGGGDTKALGELDLCNGHAGRADDYHYHAAPTCLMADQPAAYWDTHPLGWALDGYAIFGYRNPDGTTATRDALCGGNTLPHPNAPAGYAYHVTDVSPYVLSCFYGVPSPDLAGQGGKFSPLRPPGAPETATNLTLDATAASLALGGTTTMTWQSGGHVKSIRYTRTSSVCWRFVFATDGTATSTNDYCRAR